MKYLTQFTIIIAFSFLGEVLNYFLPLPIPASVYGLVLMLLALLFGIIKEAHIKETANFLIVIMPLLFLPPIVSLMENWNTINKILIPIISITVISTVLVMAVTGRFSQFIIRREESKNDK